MSESLSIALIILGGAILLVVFGFMANNNLEKDFSELSYFGKLFRIFCYIAIIAIIIGAIISFFYVGSVIFGIFIAGIIIILAAFFN